jgi:hypothetical protein
MTVIGGTAIGEQWYALTWQPDLELARWFRLNEQFGFVPEGAD